MAKVLDTIPEGEEAPNYGIHTPTADATKVKELEACVNEAKELESLIQTFESRASQERKALQDLLENRIPRLMDECGMSEVTTASGVRIKLDKYLWARIPSPSQIAGEKDRVKRAALEVRRRDGLRWLDDNGHSDLIKRSFEVNFGKDAADDAAQFRAAIPEGVDYVEGESVHYKSLENLLAELRQKRVSFPAELFGAIEKTTAVISTGKKR